VRIVLEVSDRLFRRAKSVAASRGVPLVQFLAESLREKRGPPSAAGPKPWMKHMGRPKGLQKRTELIDKRIEEAFEHIDMEE